MRWFMTVVAATAAGCAWEPPIVPLDTAAPSGVVSGSVSVVGPEAPSDTYVLLYDANNPGPPNGLGRPINFDVVPKSAFARAADGSWSAPFTLTEVPAGTYTLSGLHDDDQDFHPTIDTNGGSTCGDWGGAHVGVDPATGSLDTATITVGVRDSVASVPVVVQVPIPYERPAFGILDGQGAFADGVVGLSRDGAVTLASTAVSTEWLELGPVQDLSAPVPCGVGFLVEPLLNENPDGTTELLGFEPPQVVFTLLDDDGAVADPPVIVEGVVAYDGLPLFEQLTADDSRAPELTELSVSIGQDGRYWLPFSTTDGGDGAVADLPSGPWAITVINAAGQSWTVPNTGAGLSSRSTADFSPESQLAAVVLQ